MTEFICPYPLVTYDINDVPPDTHLIIGYPGCAAPCPSLDYRDSDWSTITNTVNILVVISFIASLIVFLAHIQEFYKYYVRIMFIGGFLANSFIIGLFVLLNREENIVCDGSAFYVKRSALCVFQAAATVWCFLWTNTWSAILAYDTYLHVSFIYKPRQDLRSRTVYTAIAIIISFGFTSVPLYYGNLGFDPEANIPICLFLISEDSTYFWSTFVFPFYFLLLCSLFLTVVCTWRVHNVFISSKHYMTHTGASSIHTGDVVTDLVHTDACDQRPSEAASVDALATERPSQVSVVAGSDGRSNIVSGSFDMNYSFSYMDPVDEDGTASGNMMSLAEAFLEEEEQEDEEVVLDTDRRLSLNRWSEDAIEEPLLVSTVRSQMSGDGLGALQRPTDEVQTQSPDGLPSRAFSDAQGDTGYCYSDFSGSRTPGTATKVPRSLLSMLYSPWWRRPSNRSNRQLNNGESRSRAASSAMASEDSSAASGSVYNLMSVYGPVMQSDDRRHEEESETQGVGLVGWCLCCLCCSSINPIQDSADAAVAGERNRQPSRTSSSGSAPDQRLLRSNSKATSRSQKQFKAALLLSAVWQYNGRSILFVIMFCVTTLAIFPLDFTLYYLDFGLYHRSGSDFISCLVNASLTCPDQSVSEVAACASSCGFQHAPTRVPDVAQLCALLAYAAAYGIIPSIIFGFSGPSCMNTSYSILKYFYGQQA